MSGLRGKGKNYGRQLRGTYFSVQSRFSPCGSTFECKANCVRCNMLPIAVDYVPEASVRDGKGPVLRVSAVVETTSLKE